MLSVAEGQTLELFRIVKTDQHDAVLRECFCSSFALDCPPRGWAAQSSVIHMALSMFEAPVQAAATARRFPAIGGFIARVRLTADHGFGVADTGPPGHVSVWGRPLQFVEAVADISNVDEHD